MNKKPKAGASSVGNKAVKGALPVMVAALLCAGGGVALLSNSGESPINAEAANIASWYVDSATAEKAADSSDYSVSVTLKGASASISCETSYTADASHGYIAVKYSGTAVFSELSVYGKQADGTTEKSGVVAAVGANGWNVTKVEGTDFSVMVANVGGYYGAGAGNLDIATVTNIGFNLTGSEGSTFTVYGIELLADANHSFGTPTPPSELTWGDWTSENAAFVGLANADGANRTVDITNLQNQPDYGQHAYIGAEYDAKEDYKYISVKYKGNATFDHITLFNDNANKNALAVNVGQNDNVTEYGSGDDAFKVVTADISSYYPNVDNHVTKIGFNIKGNADETLQILGIQLTPDGLHSFAPRGDMTISEMKMDTGAYAGTYTIAKDGENNQTVSQTKMWGGATTYVEVEFYDPANKYLVVDLKSDQALNFGLGTATNVWPNISLGYVPVPANTRKTIVYDVSGLELNDIKQEIHFFYGDGSQGEGWGADPTGWTERTVTFYGISFSETDPTASSETNHFREPEGKAGVTYSADTKKISYTNTAEEHWRYVDIPLENHDATYNVLHLNITGYNGLVLGVRALYSDGSATAYSDLIDSRAEYSKFTSAEAVDIMLYLEANGIGDKTLTGIQLYLDAPANAGVVGEQELTLNKVEMLKSGEGEFNPAATAIAVTNSEVTAAYGTTPDFGVSLTSGGTPIEGDVYVEYRAKGTDGNYSSALPIPVGEYDVRFYYLGSSEYAYSRSTTASLTVTKAAAVNATANDGVTFNETTRTIVVKEGHEASDSETDFGRRHLIENGTVLEYGTTKTVYFRAAAVDGNHEAGEVKNIQIVVPAAPVPEKELVGIAITTQPTKTVYTVGDALDIAGLVVTATYDDQSTEAIQVTAGMLSGFDMSNAGSQSVTITYNGKTASFGITVNAATPQKQLSSIAVTTQPTKTVYTVGETLDITGLVVTATYSDNSTEAVTVTSAMLSACDMSAAGTKTVTVTYEGKTATFTVTVNAAQTTPTEPSGDNNDGTEEEGLSGGAIAGIVIAVVVCLGAVAAAIVVVLKKKKGDGPSKE